MAQLARPSVQETAPGHIRYFVLDDETVVGVMPWHVDGSDESGGVAGDAPRDLPPAGDGRFSGARTSATAAKHQPSCSDSVAAATDVHHAGAPKPAAALVFIRDQWGRFVWEMLSVMEGEPQPAPSVAAHTPPGVGVSITPGAANTGGSIWGSATTFAAGNTATAGTPTSATASTTAAGVSDAPPTFSEALKLLGVRTDAFVTSLSATDGGGVNVNAEAVEWLSSLITTCSLRNSRAVGSHAVPTSARPPPPVPTAQLPIGQSSLCARVRTQAALPHRMRTPPGTDVAPRDSMPRSDENESPSVPGLSTRPDRAVATRTAAVIAPRAGAAEPVARSGARRWQQTARPLTKVALC